jgi:hypothetical protein
MNLITSRAIARDKSFSQCSVSDKNSGKQRQNSAPFVVLSFTQPAPA